MSHNLPTPKPLTSLTPAAMLMAVLDVIESPAMVEAVEEAGGVNREDGVRPPLWNMRFQANHLNRVAPSWMAELDHAVAHVAASGTAEELQGALRAVSAIAASWALAVEVRTQGGDAGE